MKNMKKLLQKAMVFTLSAAMLVGTPMTASAAGLVDLYSISDGTDIVDDKNGELVGTVTNTDTNTGAMIKAQSAKIVGIALDRETVSAEAGTEETLKATVMLDSQIIAPVKDDNGNDIIGDDGKVVTEDITDDVIAEMSKKIKWEVLYLDKDGNKKGEDAPNPAEKVMLKGEADNRSEITLIPRQGTEKGGEVTVRATIDASYYFHGETNVTSASEEPKALTWNQWKKDPNKYIIKDEREGLIYTADAKVSVKEYSKSLLWNDGENDDTIYPKQTLDLSTKIGRKETTANDAITWTSSDTKVATVNATTGVVTAKKVGTADITAVSEHGKTVIRKITVADTIKADGVKIFSVGADGKEEPVTAAIDKDLANGSDTMTLKAKMFAKVDAYKKADGTVMTTTKPEAGKENDELEVGEAEHAKIDVENGTWYIDGATKKAKQVKITDVITWTSNKATVATVVANGENATVTLKGVGTAAITAKATGGKSAKATVKVAATLKKLTIGNIPAGKTVYSGLSYPLTAIKDPIQNTDAVKWTVTKDGQKTADAKIDGKGVLKISNKVTEGEIKVTLEPKKGATKENSDEITLTVRQSSIDGFVVKEVGGETLAEVGLNNKDKVAQLMKAKTSYINVPLNKSYQAVPQNAGDATKEAVNGLNLLTWKSSNDKVAKVSGTGANATIRAVAAGKATITVSGVRFANGKASVISTKFTVQVKQPVTTLTMNKPTVVLAQKTKKVKGEPTLQNQKISLKVTFGPKNADKSQKVIDSWTIYKNGVVLADANPVKTGKGNKQKTLTAASLSYTTTEAPKAGDEYKVVAKSITGATATSIVTIVNPTTAVAIAKELKDGTLVTYDKKGEDITIGDTEHILQLRSYINQTSKKTTDKGWMLVGSEDAKKAYAEDVTYTVNKKGIVSIDKDGKVYAIKKGTVTITAKTPTGKKATLKVNVKEKTAAASTGSEK